MVAVLALLAMRRDGIPADFEYVWKGVSGVVMVLLSRTYMQMIQADRHMTAGVDLEVPGDFDAKSTGGFNQVPNGGYVASWVGSKKLDVWGESSYSKFAPGYVQMDKGSPFLFKYGLTPQSRDDDSWSPVLAAMVPRPTNDADYGEARAKLGKPNATGQVDQIVLILSRDFGRATRWKWS